MTKERMAREAANQPQMPPIIELATYRQMRHSDRAAYNDQRRRWHGSFEYIVFPHLRARVERLQRLVRDNVDGTPPFRGVWIDGSSTSGKTALAKHIARAVLQSGLDDGRFVRTPSGCELVKAAWIDVQAVTTLKSLSQDMLGYYNSASPQSRPGKDTAATIAKHVANAAIAAGTELIVFDDVHHLANRDAQRDSLGDFLKALATQVPATLIMIGTGLKHSGLLSEGKSLSVEKPPTMRRNAYMQLRPIPRVSTSDVDTWRNICASFEKRLVLLRDNRGCLTRHADLLWDWTEGHLGGLQHIVSHAAKSASLDNDEVLSFEILRAQFKDMGAAFDDDETFSTWSIS